MPSFFAVTFTGLEPIAAAEISELAGTLVRQPLYRRVCFDLDSSFVRLAGLSTVDDLFVDIARIEPVNRHRVSLDVIAKAAAEMEVADALRVISEVRDLPDRPSFSVTASFVGKRNYTSPEIKARVAGAMEAARDWSYSEDDHKADVNVRVFIEGDTAQFGLRLTARPLHTRSYGVSELPGNLKPPVAAAMVRMAQAGDRAQLLDPCCGSGTILLEGDRQGLRVSGGDIDPLAVAATRNRFGGRPVEVARWNAAALPLADASIGRIVTNLPWGEQAQIAGDGSTVYAAICEEMERVLAPGGRIVLLTTRVDEVRFRALTLDSATKISLFGKRPTILQYGR